MHRLRHSGTVRRDSGTQGLRGSCICSCQWVTSQVTKISLVQGLEYLRTNLNVDALSTFRFSLRYLPIMFTQSMLEQKHNAVRHSKG